MDNGGADWIQKTRFFRMNVKFVPKIKRKADHKEVNETDTFRREMRPKKARRSEARLIKGRHAWHP
jgi:hypothetical protein